MVTRQLVCSSFMIAAGKLSDNFHIEQSDLPSWFWAKYFVWSCLVIWTVTLKLKNVLLDKSFRNFNLLVA